MENIYLANRVRHPLVAKFLRQLQLVHHSLYKEYAASRARYHSTLHKWNTYKELKDAIELKSLHKEVAMRKMDYLIEKEKLVKIMHKCESAIGYLYTYGMLENEDKNLIEYYITLLKKLGYK